MKKVYMPSMDILYQIQDKGANVYRYLVIKNIESIVCDGVGTQKGILSRYVLDRIIDMKEYQDIVKAICLLYPKELENLKYISEGGFAKKLELDLLKEDIWFCLQLLNNLPSDAHSNLDYLAYFSYSVTSNVSVLEETLKLLKEELINNPKYRFEYLSYRENNTLLDDIFSGKIDDNDLMLFRGSSRDLVVNTLTTIEPAYAISLPDCYFSGYFGYEDINWNQKKLLNDGMNALADRYKINRSIGCEYFGKDILTNPDSEVKKLIRNIK